MSRSKYHWSKVGEAGTIFGIKILLLAYKIFGRFGFRLFLFPVMGYFYLFRGVERRSSQQYLENLQNFSRRVEDKKLSSFKHFLMFGEVLLDKFLVWLGQIKQEDILLETPSVLTSDRRGGVIIVSHLGNIEICSALAHQMPGIRLTLLVYTQHAKKFNAVIQQVSNDSCVDILQVTEMTPATAMILSERVGAGEYVAIAGDRTPVTSGGRASEVQFLGQSAMMPQGAFILASLLKCPVYLMFCLKQQEKYHIYIELFSEQIAMPRKNREQIILNNVQQYAKRLEVYCLKAPLQWFNFFPFWNDNEPE